MMGRGARGPTQRPNDGFVWIAVVASALTAEERRRRDRRNAVFLSSAFVVANALALAQTVLSGMFNLPRTLVAFVVVDVLVGALLLDHYRRVARSDGRGLLGISGGGRVGSSPERLCVRGGAWKVNVPWSKVDPPRHVETSVGGGFLLRYRTSAGFHDLMHLTASWMDAILRLPHLPDWELSIEFRTALSRELSRERAVQTVPS